METYCSAERGDYISNIEEAMELFYKMFLCKEKDGASRNQQELLKAVFSNDWG